MAAASGEHLLERVGPKAKTLGTPSMHSIGHLTSCRPTCPLQQPQIADRTIQ